MASSSPSSERGQSTHPVTGVTNERINLVMKRKKKSVGWVLVWERKLKSSTFAQLTSILTLQKWQKWEKQTSQCQQTTLKESESRPNSWSRNQSFLCTYSIFLVPSTFTVTKQHERVLHAKSTTGTTIGCQRGTEEKTKRKLY